MAVREMRVAAFAAAVLLVGACSGDSGTGPKQEAPKYNLSIQSGDQQIGVQGERLSQPLQVVVSDAQTEEPVGSVDVTWSVVSGAGASVSPAISTTNSSGVASTTVTLGPATGAYTVQATVQDAVVQPVIFTASAVSDPPSIGSVEPSSAFAGDTVTVMGQNFGSQADKVRVLFDGFGGQVLSVTDTQIRATVPLCLPTRHVQVTVALGGVLSNGVSLPVTGGKATPLQLSVGGVVTIADPADLRCLTFDPASSGTKFLVVVQNAATVANAPMPFTLTAIGDNTSVASLSPTMVPGAAAAARRPSGAAPDPQEAFESRLRRNERGFRPGDFIRRPSYTVSGDVSAAVPSVGDRKTFQVVNKDNMFTSVTAEVQYVGQHGIIYQDVKAPANGFKQADFERFATLFDDPIYDTDVATYGSPSDIDGNGHVDILFTPVVNELTPKGSTGFVAGFFYGNDLTTNQGSNRGEIFYSIVPDPDGKYGDARTADKILQTVPSTLAHEFMHMIHFNQRVLIRGGFDLDALWLSEGLAHTAEDIVGHVFEQRGNIDQADEFEGANYARAFYYLSSFKDSPDHTYDVSLLSENGFGSLEQRGAAWLLLKYLTGLQGTGLLKDLVQTTLSSTTNVSQHVGRSWESIFSDWCIALYADNDPELSISQIDPRYQFADIDLRSTISSSQYGGFALKPETHDFGNFSVTATLPSSSPYFLILQAQGSSPVTSLNLVPQTSSTFPGAAEPQISVLRLN